MSRRIEVNGRVVIVETVKAERGLYVNRLRQVVKRPRACGESSRVIWPRAKIGAVARAAMAQLDASEQSGLIRNALAKCGGAA